MPKRAERIALERVASDTTLSRKTKSEKMNTFGTLFEKIVVEGKSANVPGTLGAKPPVPPRLDSVRFYF